LQARDDAAGLSGLGPVVESTSDFQEGVKAMAERRLPIFTDDDRRPAAGGSAYANPTTACGT
jgi:hypothetical protein